MLREEFRKFDVSGGCTSPTHIKFSGYSAFDWYRFLQGLSGRIELVIRRFLGDDYVMRVAFNQTSIGDAHQASLGS